MKALSEAQRNVELIRLVEEQWDDMSSKFVYPEKIVPLSPTILEDLTNKEKASIVLNVVAKMSYRDIADAMDCSHTSVTRYLKTAYKKLRNKFIV